MLIGIMADSHDNLPLIEQAVSFFNRRGVELVLHAGDFIAPFVERKLKYLSCPLIGVFGNNDGEKKGLREKISQIGEIHTSPYFFQKKGYSILLSHQPVKRKEIQAFSPDLIVWGHTHQPLIRKEGSLLLVNPGECGGWLTDRPSVAWADLKKRQAQLVYLEKGESG